MRRIPRAVIAGAVAFVVTLILSRGRSTPYDNYVLLARALLEGHAWIDWPGPYIDALFYHGHYYVIEAPLPALLLLPVVAIFHDANQTLLAVMLAAVAIGAAWELGERYGLSPATNAWLCAFLLAGTDLLWCAMLGDVWFIAHVSAACFTLLALVELSGKRRGWLVALWAACAAESRFTLLLALPVYAYLLATDPDRPFVVSPRARRALLSFGGILVPIAVLWALYNEARWGTWSDIGYTAWYHQDQVGMPTGSPFRLQYLGYQLQSFFVQGPSWIRTYPWVVPGMSGVALTWTSPALILAFFASRPARLVWALWAAALLVALPNFLYYVNGFAQFGMRHALDFEPFLIALMMLAVRERLPRWGMALIVYSVLVGLWGCWFWSAFVRSG
ncbi:MAG TPA: hypothetical protein VIN40_04970 [Candidatus Tyrphobacter sp.]